MPRLSDRRERRPAKAVDRDRLALRAFYVFAASVALFGGSSRADSLAQIVVRAVSILFVAGLVLMRVRPDFRGLRPVFALLVALALLIGAQLVPLPPAIWTGLPGRALYIEATAALGLAQPWRPIAISPDRGWNALFSLVPPFAAAFGVACIARADRAKLLPVVLIIVAASALAGVAQLSGAGSVFQPYATNDPNAAAGLFANRNHGALLLALGLPILAVWAVRSGTRRGQKSRRPLWGAGLAILLLMAIPTTGSRTGLVLAGLALAIAVLTIIRPLRAAFAELPRRVRVWAGAGSVGLLGVLFFASLTLGQAASVQRFSLLDASEDLRAKTLPILVRITEDFFPFGIGFGAFDPVFRRLQPFELLSFTYLNQAHNDWLQFVLEGGAVGALLLVGGVVWWAARTARLWRAPGGDPAVTLGRMASGCLLLIALASVVDYPLRTPLMMVIGVVVASWLFVYDPRAPLPGDGRGTNRTLPRRPSSI